MLGLRRFLRRLGILDWILLLAMLAGGLLILVYLAVALLRGTITPFPLYDQKLDAAETWLLRLYGGLYLLWALSTLLRALRTGNLILHLVWVLMVVPWGIGYVCWKEGLPAINGLFDRSPAVPTKMWLKKITESSSRGRYGARGGHSSMSAHVNRLDHPQEEVAVGWPGCALPKGTFRSSHITMFFHRGALGVPWVEPRVECRPMPIDEWPLFGSFRVARGQAIAIFALEDKQPHQDEVDRSWDARASGLVRAMTDLATGNVQSTLDGVVNVERHCDLVLSDDERKELARILERMHGGPEDKRRQAGQQALTYVKSKIDLHTEETVVARWLHVVEQSGLGPEIAMVRYGHHAALPRGIDCARCRALLTQNLDKPVLHLLTGGQDLWNSAPPSLFIADGQGHRLFHAPLTAVERLPELAKTLATAVAAPR